MNPIALAGPAVEPISLAEMKTYLRLDGTDEDEDDVVSALIVAARVTVELHTRLALIAQSWRYALSGWPVGRRVRIPLHPVIAIEAVRVSRETGSPTVLAASLYGLDAGGGTDEVAIDPAAPEPAGRPARIEIDFSCGFGPSPNSIPEPLRLAIRRLVAFWFEHRGDERQPGPPSLPPDVIALLAPFVRARLA